MGKIVNLIKKNHNTLYFPSIKYILHNDCFQFILVPAIFPRAQAIFGRETKLIVFFFVVVVVVVCF